LCERLDSKGRTMDKAEARVQEAIELDESAVAVEDGHAVALAPVRARPPISRRPQKRESTEKERDEIRLLGLARGKKRRRHTGLPTQVDR
jgi:hypothetical protein